jgi:pentatricopeptide repeat protein
MRREGQEPDEECYASIMSAANARGHKANLLQLYHDMRAHNLLPSRGAYSMVVAACLDLKQWDAMDKILHEMREIAQYKVTQRHKTQGGWREGEKDGRRLA